jgi:dihydrofolate synthase/folylpolyglutamate synthase
MPAPSGPIRDLAAARSFLDGLVNHERATVHRARTPFDLDRFRRLTEALGHPERSCPALHVGGTKGKGSTCALAAAVFRAAGLRVGLYLSPHVTTELERIQVDGVEIAPEAFVAGLERLRPLLGADGGRRPTWFEALTALALDHFRERRVDVAVLEVGLGGRLDATNVVRPECAVITNVSLDHTAVLGSTVAAIAREKAGIVKDGVPVLTGAEGEALDVIAAAAARARAPLLRLGEEVRVAGVRPEPGRAEVRFDLVTPAGAREGLVVGLAGRHQATNAAVAVAAAEVVAERTGRALPDEAVRGGLRAVRLPGRLEELPGGVILDGAHNVAAMEALARALGDHHPGRRFVTLFGCAADKDAAGMLRALAPVVEELVLTAIPSPRSADPEALRARAGVPAVVAADPVAGLEEARRRAGGAPVLVTGSFYLVGLVRTSRPGAR